MKNFEGLGLSEALNNSLSKMGYSAPTPIQAEAIPMALQGHDILGSAQTGTGKTAAFSIPLVEMLLRTPGGSALVLTPTRELAKQVLTVINQLLGYKSPIKTAFIIGGESMSKQFSQLRANPRIIVGTPGRVNDHLERGSLKLDDAAFLVLDETDRMLDMGFGIQLDKIVAFLPENRQTLMFSATMPDDIQKLSKKYLNNPERISMGATNTLAKNIKQDVIRIEQDQKYKELVNQLHERNGSVIIFAKTKRSADKIAKNLCRDGFEADALHGDLRQGKRTSVMNKFRAKKFRILVATDIAARGLDVPHIEHVVNYDLPQVAEDYIHRMGRTARAGAEGSALCFVSGQDNRKWHAIEQLLNPDKAQNNKQQRSGNKNGGQGNRKPRNNNGYNSNYSKSEKPRRPGKAPYARKDGDKKYGDNDSNYSKSEKPRRPGKAPYARKDGDKKYGDNDSNYSKSERPKRSGKAPYQGKDGDKKTGRNNSAGKYNSTNKTGGPGKKHGNKKHRPQRAA